MNRRREIVTLRDVAKIRALQSAAAEAATAEAAAVKRDRDADICTCEDRLSRLEDGWRTAIGGAFAPDAALSWSRAVRHGAASLRDAEASGAQAEARLHDHRIEWRGAQLRDDGARAAVMKAERSWRKEREETALHAATELLLSWRPRA